MQRRAADEAPRWRPTLILPARSGTQRAAARQQPQPPAQAGTLPKAEEGEDEEEVAASPAERPQKKESRLVEPPEFHANAGQDEESLNAWLATEALRAEEEARLMAQWAEEDQREAAQGGSPTPCRAGRQESSGSTTSGASPTETSVEESPTSVLAECQKSDGGSCVVLEDARAPPSTASGHELDTAVSAQSCYTRSVSDTESVCDYCADQEVPDTDSERWFPETDVGTPAASCELRVDAAAFFGLGCGSGFGSPLATPSASCELRAGFHAAAFFVPECGGYFGSTLATPSASCELGADFDAAAFFGPECGGGFGSPLTTQSASCELRADFDAAAFFVPECGGCFGSPLATPSVSCELRADFDAAAFFGPECGGGFGSPLDQQQLPMPYQCSAGWPSTEQQPPVPAVLLSTQPPAVPECQNQTPPRQSLGAAAPPPGRWGGSATVAPALLQMEAPSPAASVPTPPASPPKGVISESAPPAPPHFAPDQSRRRPSNSSTSSGGPGKLLQKCKIRKAADHRQVEAQAPRQRSGGFTSVMIRNLPRDLTKEDLVKELASSGFGEALKNMHLPLESGRGTRCKGYAFVNLSSAPAAAALMVLWHKSRRFSGRDAGLALDICPSTWQPTQSRSGRSAEGSKAAGVAPARRPMVGDFRPSPENFTPALEARKGVVTSGHIALGAMADSTQAEPPTAPSTPSPLAGRRLRQYLHGGACQF